MWQGTRQEGFDAKHVPLFTLWAITQRFASELLVAIPIILKTAVEQKHKICKDYIL